MFFDDFKVGDTFDIKSVTIEKDKMIEFAQDYDPQKIHLDEEHGKESRYGDIIAPGIMSFMSVWAEFVKSNIISRNFISASNFSVNWLAPVYADDTLTGKAIIKKLTPRNKYNGVVEINLLVYNHDGDMVMDTTTHAIIKTHLAGVSL